MKIHVTWSDIRDGEAAKTAECMVALALKRELGVGYASIGYRDATVVARGEMVNVYLPQDVRKKIRFWDLFHIMVPFSFELCCSGFLTGREAFVSSSSGKTPALATQGALLADHA